MEAWKSMGRNSNDIAEIEWLGYTGKKAVFPVCMRSPAVRGRSLIAQMQAAAENLDHLCLLICDSLDRHNMRGMDDAKTASIDLADTWLDGNLERIKPYFETVEVIRWEKDIRSHPLFDERVRQLYGLRESSPAYRDLVHALSSYYLDSKKRRFEADRMRGLVTSFDSNEAYESSRAYLEEEFAGNMVCHDLTAGLPHIYHGLYIDDVDLFVRESACLDLAYPKTLPVVTKRLGSSLAASSLEEHALRAAA